MPTENSYRVRCGETEYLIQPGEILIICPGILHELFAPEHGKRIIFQPNLGQLRTKGAGAAYLDDPTGDSDHA